MEKAELQEGRDESEDIDMIRYFDTVERLQDENPELLAAIDSLFESPTCVPFTRYRNLYTK